MGKEQKFLIAKQIQEESVKAKRRAERIEKYKFEFGLFVAFIILCFALSRSQQDLSQIALATGSVCYLVLQCWWLPIFYQWFNRITLDF
jgi:hypothetical protein